MVTGAVPARDSPGTSGSRGAAALHPASITHSQPNPTRHMRSVYHRGDALHTGVGLNYASDPLTLSFSLREKGPCRVEGPLSRRERDRVRGSDKSFTTAFSCDAVPAGEDAVASGNVT